MPQAITSFNKRVRKISALSVAEYLLEFTPQSFRLRLSAETHAWDGWSADA
jgi:hypothetical protein